jgi:hypothetical protein
LLKNIEEVSHLRARTIKPDGAIVDFDGKVFEKSLVKTRGLKYLAKTFTFPAVEPGCIIEYSYTLDLRFPYASHWILSEALFTKRARFSLKPYKNSYIRLTLRWALQNLPPGADTTEEGPDHIIRMAKPRNDIRHAWEKALKDAEIDHFWIYNLRHTFASRLSAAGVSDLFVAQMIGHNSPGILQKYSKAIDEYRRDAVRKLEGMRADHVLQGREPARPTEAPKSPPEPGPQIRENYYSLTTVRGFPQGKRPLRRCSVHS